MRVSKALNLASGAAIPTLTLPGNVATGSGSHTRSQTKMWRRARRLGLPIALLLSYGCDDSLYPPIVQAPLGETDDGSPPASDDSGGAAGMPSPGKPGLPSKEDAEP